jgi:alpha-L-fucosidase
MMLALATTALAAAGAPPAFTERALPAGATMPVPTAAQLKYQGEISALIHFGMATFFHDGDPGCDAKNWHGCDTNGGLTTCNSSDVSSFAPTNLNVSAWIDSFQALGATSAVLTAKHGCGFLAWKTNTTLPDGKPYRYHVPDHLPVLEQFVAATTAAGIGHGFYYSLTNNYYLKCACAAVPPQLHALVLTRALSLFYRSPQPRADTAECLRSAAGHNAKPKSTALPGQAPVTQAEYEAIQLSQVKELWTAFGPLTEVWLDGGCGALCDKIGALVKDLPGSKGAVAFNGGGTTYAAAASTSPVRWCGTEGGNPKEGAQGAVWSTAACGWCASGSGSGDPPNATGAYWYPSGVDVTIQSNDHWFFTPGDTLRPLSQLISMYHDSVGANGHLEIDFAIVSILPRGMSRHAVLHQPHESTSFALCSSVSQWLALICMARVCIWCVRGLLLLLAALY